MVKKIIEKWNSEKWFEIFERNAEAYDFSELQKYVKAIKRMKGQAKLFLESEYGAEQSCGQHAEWAGHWKQIKLFNAALQVSGGTEKEFEIYDR